MIKNFSDFTAQLLEAGFSVHSGDGGGIFGLIPFDWTNTPFGSPVRWHTGNPDTDPWEWRIRILEERRDIAYGKVFFRKSGFITRQWYPYFLAARRDGETLDEAYENGKISRHAKLIYDTLRDNGPLPVHEIKRVAGFSGEDKSRFDRALTGLQMELYITMCGREQKINRMGEGYGWFSTSLCLTEDFWDSDVFEEADALTAEQAETALRRQILRLNPNAEEKLIKKFIYGK
jgi:hypothetical protein